MKPKLIIDAETAARWGREAMEAGDEGSVLAGRPPHLRERDRQAQLQSRLRLTAIAASAASICFIAGAYTTGRWSVLLAAAGFAGIGIGSLLASARSARVFERERGRQSSRVPT